MDDRDSTLRERALQAWQERKQEIAVDAERRDTERKLQIVRAATRWALRATGAPAGESFDVQEQVEAARLAGIEAHDPRPVIEDAAGSPWTVDIIVDHVRLRYTGVADWSPDDRFELIGECPDCGEDVIFGYRITSLIALGIALDEQMTNPKQGHRCPAPEGTEYDDDPVVEFAPTIVEPFDNSVDPAHVLMDALQGYVHAAVTAAVDARTLTAEEAF